MNRERIIELLGPFIRGEIRKEKRLWGQAAHDVAMQIPVEEIKEATEILETMFLTEGENEIPSAHAVHTSLAATKVELEERRRGEKRR